MKIFFDHERLKAYQAGLTFMAWSEPILERLPKTAAIYSQLDRARLSIVLNTAEGNGKFTPPDRCKYFDTARGSAVECAACLDALRIQSLVAEQEAEAGKTILSQVVAMLVGLMKSVSPDRFGEEATEYRVEEGTDGRGI